MFDAIKIKFGAWVCHDRPHLHPRLHRTVERDFYDRADIAANLENMLKSDRRKPVIIVGERRAGKTSLLRLMESRLNNDSSRRFIAFVIDWDGVTSTDKLAREILSEIAEHLPVRSLSQHIMLPNAWSIDEFADAVRGLLPADVNLTVVIGIDELNSIFGKVDAQEQQKILQLVSALVETSDLPVRLMLTLVGAHNRIDDRLMSLVSNSEPFHVGPFDRNDLHEMINDLVGQDAERLTPQDLQRIFELSGGWPYYAKLLLASLAEVTKGKAWMSNPVEHALLYAKRYPGVEQTLEAIYSEHLSDDEKMLMMLLAQQRVVVEGELDVMGESLHTAATNLQKRGYIEKQTDGNYRFRIGFLGEWFPSWVRFDEEIEKRLKRRLTQRGTR
ncbi:MAG: AAA-like domain-containing protein [Chloroflexi bacterium]|nr:AAA-like domain-containing protein [Chloroflexota bacterium]